VPAYSSPDPASGGLRRQIWGTILVLLTAGSILSLPDALQERFAGALRSSALAPFIALNSAIIDVGARAEDAERLQVMVDSLTLELQARTTLDEENRRLRDLLVLADRLPRGWLAAEAVRPGLQASEGIFYLDVGPDEGVKTRAPVVTREGLAGVLRTVETRSQAEGMDWSHPEFAASAMSEDGLTYGIVEARRGAFREQDRLVFLHTPFNTVLDSGTHILTSGRGGVFPRGIPIGRIESVIEEEGGFERNYLVTPFVEPGEMTLVMVERADTDEPPRGDPAPGDGVPNALVSGDSIEDIGTAWPPEERMRADERARMVPVWQDSLRQLRDSIAGLLGVAGDTTGPVAPR